MIEYTEKIHAKRMIKILESKEPCTKCPRIKNYTTYNYSTSKREGIEIEIYGGNEKICNVCKKFIKLDTFDKCPCHTLGSENAVKKTWITLEEKGYI